MLALGLVTALAVLDLVLGDDAVLVELLAAGPLRRGRRARGPGARRSWPATRSPLSVPLGLARDAFGSLQHVVGMLAWPSSAHWPWRSAGTAPGARTCSSASAARARRPRAPGTSSRRCSAASPTP